jgi:hypothetical protein
MEFLIFWALVPLNLLQVHQWARSNWLINTAQTSGNFNMTDFSFKTRRK